MTVSSTTTKVAYTGNNVTTVFAYTFKIFAEAEIKVYVDNVLKSLTTHYTLSGVDSASGGNVTFTTGNTPGTGAKVVFVRSIARTQVVDYVENDTFPAETHEAALDKLTFIVQELDNSLTGDIFRFAESVSDAGTVTITLDATARASKLLAFDASGDLQATQEIGTYTGNWAASTAYALRDLIKDTSNNNIYICTVAHTSSGSQPISSNTDVAKWALIVDAASATTSATAAASSATSAASSATAAAASATSAASSASTASTQATNAASSASTASTQASNASTSASTASTQATNAATSATASASSATASASSATSSAADAVSTAADVTSSGTNATNAASSASTATTQASAASTSATAASTSATSAATSATTATTQASAASTSASAASASAAAAAASADGIDDVYLGAKASDPATDNDGDALNAGDWYYNTTSSITRIYNGSAWEDVSVSPSTVVTKTSTTGSASLPAGTTAQRDGSPSAGYLRWNTTDTTAEVYNGSGWVEVGASALATRTVDTMTGDNSDTTLTLGQDPGSENNVTVTFDGVTQHHDTYSVSGTTLTFSTAPATGVKVEAVAGGLESIGTPSDSTVTNAKIAEDISVANGGTGASTHTANSVLVGEGTSAISSIAPSTSGNVLTSNGTVWQSTAPAGGGKVLQMLSSFLATTDSTTKTIPFDDTNVRHEEGELYTSVTITPESATSTIHIRGFMHLSRSVVDSAMAFITQSGGNSSSTGGSYCSTTTDPHAPVIVDYIVASASTSARTYNLYFSGSSEGGGTTYVNQMGGGTDKYNGSMKSGMIVTEYEA